MNDRRRGLIIGLVLILVGLVGLVPRYYGYGEMTGGTVLWLIAAGFFMAYWSRRILGFLIAGSMVAAIGTFVMLQAFRPAFPADSGGLFFILIAAAFFFIYLVGTRPDSWPIIPGLATLGFGVFILSMEFRGWRIYVFPVLLMAAGVWMILRPRFRRW